MILLEDLGRTEEFWIIEVQRNVVTCIIRDSLTEVNQIGNG